MKNKTTRFALFFVIAALLIAFDQFTKHLAVGHLKGQDAIPLIQNVLYFLYVENFGAAFGMMEGMRVVFYAITLLVACGILFTVWKLPKERRYAPLFFVCMLIFSGAIGNLIDRASHRYVVDFIYFSPIDFPVFNVADIYVTVGCVLLIALFLFVYQDDDFAFLKRGVR